MVSPRKRLTLLSGDETRGTSAIQQSSPLYGLALPGGRQPDPLPLPWGHPHPGAEWSDSSAAVLGLARPLQRLSWPCSWEGHGGPESFLTFCTQTPWWLRLISPPAPCVCESVRVSVCESVCACECACVSVCACECACVCACECMYECV